VAKIVFPVTASLLAAMAAGMYLVWICKLRGKHTFLQESQVFSFLGVFFFQQFLEHGVASFKLVPLVVSVFSAFFPLCSSICFPGGRRVAL